MVLRVCSRSPSPPVLGGRGGAFFEAPLPLYSGGEGSFFEAPLPLYSGGEGLG